MNWHETDSCMPYLRPRNQLHVHYWWHYPSRLHTEKYNYYKKSSSSNPLDCKMSTTRPKVMQEKHYPYIILKCDHSNNLLLIIQDGVCPNSIPVKVVPPNWSSVQTTRHSNQDFLDCSSLFDIKDNLYCRQARIDPQRS